MAAKSESGDRVLTINSPLALEHARVELRFVDALWEDLRTQTRQRITAALQILAGKPIPDFDTKEDIANELRTQLRRVNLFIACPKCGEPATIRCSKPGTSKSGMFQFHHGSPEGKQVTHTVKSGEFPDIKLWEPGTSMTTFDEETAGACHQFAKRSSPK